jgi:hypothetical protein
MNAAPSQIPTAEHYASILRELSTFYRDWVLVELGRLGSPKPYDSAEQEEVLKTTPLAKIDAMLVTYSSVSRLLQGLSGDASPQTLNGIEVERRRFVELKIALDKAIAELKATADRPPSTDVASATPPTWGLLPNKPAEDLPPMQHKK